MALLLNPRVWAALICAGFLVFSHFTMYRFGKGVVTNAWNAEKLAVATEVRRLEQARTSAVINATPPRLDARGLLWLMLGVLLLSCSACATQSPVVTVAPNPAPPQLTQPLPTQSYLSEAQKLLQTLRKDATGM